VETAIFEKLMEFGVLGFFCGILIIFIYKQQKQHKVERDESREERRELSDTNNKNFLTLVEVTEKNTAVVNGLKGTMEAIQQYVRN